MCGYQNIFMRNLPRPDDNCSLFVEMFHRDKGPLASPRLPPPPRRECQQLTQHQINFFALSSRCGLLCVLSGGSRETTKGPRCFTNMHRFEKRIFKIRLFFYYNEKSCYMVVVTTDNDIQEHVPLKNDSM